MKRECVPETFRSLLRAFQTHQRIAEVAKGFGIIRFRGQGVLVADNGILRPAQVLEHIAKVAVRFGQIRTYGKGLAIAGHGVFPPAEAFERVSKVHMIGRNPGIGCNGPVETLNGLFVPAGLAFDESQQMVCVGVFRNGFKNFPIKRFRLVE